MNKNKILYFRKTHRLLINTIVFRSSCNFHYSSSSFSDNESMLSTTIIQPNKTIDITTIDVIQKGKEIIDSEVDLKFYVMRKKIKTTLAHVVFDLQREKILSPNSSEMYKKNITEGEGIIDGFIQYKFIGLNTSQISEQTYKQSLAHKNEVTIEEKKLQVDQDYQRILSLVQEKDKVIKNMEDQIHKLMSETKKLTINLRDQSMSKDYKDKSPISLNINVKPSNKIQNQHRKLTRENQTLKAKMFKMSEIIQKIEREKRILQQEIQFLNQSVLGKLSDKNQKNGTVSNDPKQEERKNMIEEMKRSYLKHSQTIQENIYKKQFDLPEYSQINKRLNAEAKQLKQQIENANKFEDINVQKDVLLQKLKNSMKEGDLLKSQIQNLNVYIRKLTDELKSLRKNSTGDNIMNKIDAIHSQNQKAIEDIKRKGGISADMQIFALQKQNLMIEMELMRKQLEEYKSKLDIIQAQNNGKLKEAQIKIYKLQTREGELVKQRDGYKIQLDDTKMSLGKALNINVSNQNIGSSTEELAGKLSIAVKQKEIVDKNLENLREASNTMKERLDKTLVLLKDRTEQADRGRKAEAMNKILSQKVLNDQKQMKKFQKKYNDLKNLAINIENTYYNKKKFGSDQKYEEEMVSKLKTFQELMKNSEQEFYTSQIQTLKQDKNKLIQFYYNQLAKEFKKIDEDTAIPPDNKKSVKQAKEVQIQKTKKYELQQVEKKIVKLEVRQEEMKERTAQTIPERIANMEKKMKMSSEKNQSIVVENEKLKESLSKINDTLKEKSNELNQLKESGRLTASGFINNLSINQAANNNISEIRGKYLQEWTKINDQTKKKLTKTLTENTELKVKIGQLTTQIERGRMQKQRIQKTSQTQAREIERNQTLIKLQSDKILDDLRKRIESATIDNTSLKEQKAELQKNINTLLREIENVQYQYQMKCKENSQQQNKIQKYQSDIAEYQKGVRELLNTVDQIKKNSESDKENFTKLLEERSQTFIKIQKIKDAEKQKLQNIKEELQERIEAEIYENIKFKQQNQSLFNANAQLRNQNGEIKESMRMLNDGYNQEKKDLNQRLTMYEEVNQELEKNLISLAEDYNKMEEQLTTMRISKEAVEKQIQMFKDLDGKFRELEKQKSSEKDQMNVMLIDKKEQLKKYQTDFTILQEKIKMVSQENQKIRVDNFKLDSQVQTLRARVNQKSLQIISVTEQKSLITIQKARKDNQIEDLTKKLRETEKNLQKMKQELGAANEQLNMLQQSKFKIKHHDSVRSLHNSREQAELQRKQSDHQKRMLAVVQQTNKEDLISKIEEEPLAAINALIENVDDTRTEKEDKGNHHDQLIQQYMENRSIKSERSNRSKKSNYSKRKTDNNFYMNKTPEIMEIASNDAHEREMQLMNEIQMLQDERDDLMNQMAEMKIQLQQLKWPTDKKREADNIKIDDSLRDPNNVTQSLSFKPNLVDSRQLNNTNECSQKEKKELQLFVEQLQKEKAQLLKELAEQKENNEKLLKVEQEMNKLQEDYQNKIDQLNKEYQDKYQQFQSVKKQNQHKIEEILAQLLQKQSVLTQTLHQLQNAQQKISNFQMSFNSLEIKCQDKERQIQQYSDKIKKLKIQFRKYEEDAQLQILTLKEKFDEVVQLSKEKDDQMSQMVEKYLNLQEGADHQSNQMNRVQVSFDHTVSINFKLQAENDKLLKEKEEFNATRKTLMKRIHDLQVDLMNKHEEIMEANKNASLAISKTNIKLDSNQEEMKNIRKKMEQKENVILALKNQIALYNQECTELKRNNQELDYQLQKVTKELKEIMLNYQNQFQQINKKKITVVESLENYQKLLKEKEQKLSQIRSQMRQSQKTRIRAEDELKDLKGTFDRYKQAKQRQLNQKCTQFEMTNSELLTIKATFQKITEQNFINETKVEQERDKYKNLFKQYKQKMAKYEECMEDLSKQLNQLSDRPSKESWEQALFQNQIYKNRVEELQQQSKNQNNNQDDALQKQFRRYKANKQALIKSLQLQMDGYSSKINELQQGNYYLKKQNQNLRNQLLKVSEAKCDLQQEVKHLQEDVEQLREEVQYYKNKRKQGLTKLLNDTDD